MCSRPRPRPERVRGVRRRARGSVLAESNQNRVHMKSPHHPAPRHGRHKCPTNKRVDPPWRGPQRAHAGLEASTRQSAAPHMAVGHVGTGKRTWAVPGRKDASASASSNAPPPPDPACRRVISPSFPRLARAGNDQAQSAGAALRNAADGSISARGTSQQHGVFSASANNVV